MYFTPDSDRSILSHTYQYVLVLYGYHFWCDSKEYLYPRPFQNSRDLALALSVFSNMRQY